MRAEELIHRGLNFPINLVDIISVLKLVELKFRSTPYRARTWQINALAARVKSSLRLESLDKVLFYEVEVNVSV